MLKLEQLLGLSSPTSGQSAGTSKVTVYVNDEECTGKKGTLSFSMDEDGGW